MEYEVVEMEEIVIAGVSAVASNTDPKMGKIISDLWSRLYSEGEIEGIKNRVNEYAYGLYSDYDKDGNYRVTAGCMVSKDADNDSEKYAEVVLPRSRYAKFSVKGDMITAVANAWEEIWKMDLSRAWTGDFEEYVDSNMDGNASINIYISLK